jgi:CDGSH-type Zn-finger protein
MAEVQVVATEDGPYKVTGPIELIDPEGNPLSAATTGTVFLCRCGGSTNKPFCDGTHSRIGFRGAMAAVTESEET